MAKKYVNLRKKTGKNGDFLVGTHRNSETSYFVFKDEKSGGSIIKSKKDGEERLKVIVDSMTTLENDYGTYDMGKDNEDRTYFLSRNPNAGQPAKDKEGNTIEFDGKPILESDFKLVIAE